MQLKLQGPASYTCSDPIAVATWLTEQGYRTEDPRSQYEYLRLRKARSLIVVYHNGTILLQGTDLDSPRHLFTPHIARPAVTEPLPF